MTRTDPTSPQAMDTLRETFIKPPAEFTEMPFWFLNGELEAEEMKRQLRDFKAHGLDGIVLHPRLGLADDIEYLSDKYLGLIREAVEEAHRLDMKVMLYDEAMYPSGSAHGLVVKGNPEYAARAIRLEPFEEVKQFHLQEGEELLAALAVKEKDGYIHLDTAIRVEQEKNVPDGYEGYAIIATYSHGTIRGVHFGEDDGEPAAPKAADLLNPEAMQKFLRVTYDAYYNAFREYFGTTVIAFFTDEPSIMGRCVDEKKLRPWSKDFLPIYEQAGNEVKDLLALWLDVGEQTETLRRRYRRCINEQLGKSYYDQLSHWCEMHHIALTGHPASSEDIGCLRHFQIPGQDVVWRWVAPEKDLSVTGKDSTLAKCASDGARHSGARRNLNECLGCCGPVGHPWDFTAGEMKWYMDWLFVRGTNLLVPHAFLYSVDGEPRYNERPPDVGPNNAWWPYYRYFADYAKRLSWLNTDSRNTTKVAVLCEEDHLPWKITRQLYEHQIEFNYLEDQLLSTKDVRIENGVICIARQAYTVLLIEDPDALDHKTAARIESFRRQGGTVLTMEDDILTELDRLQVAEARLIPGCAGIRFTHLQKGGKSFYLFTNEGQQPYRGRAVLKGCGTAEIWDAWTGRTAQAEVVSPQGEPLTVALSLMPCESVIVAVDPEAKPQAPSPVKREQVTILPLREGWRRRKPDGDWKPIDTLDDWTRESELHDYWGTMDYEHDIELPSRVKGEHVFVELGGVGELAEVCIDGKSQGVSLWAPYQVDITAALNDTSRRARITVRVTSSTSRRFTKRVRPSGLMGPVDIKIVR